MNLNNDIYEGLSKGLDKRERDLLDAVHQNHRKGTIDTYVEIRGQDTHSVILKLLKLRGFVCKGRFNPKLMEWKGYISTPNLAARKITEVKATMKAEAKALAPIRSYGALRILHILVDVGLIVAAGLLLI